MHLSRDCAQGARPIRTLPKSRDGFFAWADARVEAFAQHAAAIGLSQEEIAQYVEALSEAHAADLAQRQAMLAAKAATLAANLAEARARELTAQALATIRLTAAKSGDRGVYALALIAPPRQATPLAPPGQPYRIEATLMPQGSLSISWEAENPAGSSNVTYNVLRKLQNEDTFQLVATVGMKKFVDVTLPRATSEVTYAIQGQRGRVRGATSLPVPIFLGVVGPAGRPGQQRAA